MYNPHLSRRFSVQLKPVYLPIRQTCRSGCLMLALLTILSAPLMPLLPDTVLSAWAQDYVYYYDQGSFYYKQGELSKSIDMYERALPLARDRSIPVIYNNLAAVYMRRGNYYISTRTNDDKALADFRRAYYLMEYGWPSGFDRTDMNDENRKIARQNLMIGYNNLRINPNDKQKHLDLAQELRLQGRFQEAVVEYGRVNEIDKNEATALRSMGDLFNILSRPDKAKTYYSALANVGGAGLDDEVLARLGNAQMQDGDFDGAVKSLNQALEINPKNQSALNQLESIWKKEISVKPNSVTGHANLAGVFQKKGMYPQALEQYNAAEHFATADRSTPFEVTKLIRLNMGTLFQQTRQFDQAQQAYDTVLQVDPKNEIALQYKASLLKETGKTDEAIRTYHQLLAINPSHEGAHDELLKLISGIPDKNKATAGMKEYGNRYSNNVLVQNKVGEWLHQQQDYQGALGYYQRALAINPDNAVTIANMGAAYQALGQNENALQAFRRAASLDPKNETVKKLLTDAQQSAGYENYNKAIALQQAGKHQESIPYFEKALQTDGNNTDLIAAYGIALQNTGRVFDAINQYQKALAMEPQNGSYAFYLATAYHQNQELPKALAAYQRALTATTSLDDTSKAQAQEAIASIEQNRSSTLLNQVAETYASKNYLKALALINDVLKTDSQNTTAYYYQGLIYSDQNKVDQAIGSYRSALRFDPEFKDAYFGLGVALDKKSDAVGAKSAYQKFVELSPNTDDDFVKYARERLSSL